MYVCRFISVHHCFYSWTINGCMFVHLYLYITVCTVERWTDVCLSIYICTSLFLQLNDERMYVCPRISVHHCFYSWTINGCMFVHLYLYITVSTVERLTDVVCPSIAVHHCLYSWTINGCMFVHLYLYITVSTVERLTDVVCPSISVHHCLYSWTINGCMFVHLYLYITVSTVERLTDVCLSIYICTSLFLQLND